MNRREQLREQYEDALFALLMDEMVQAEEEKAQKEDERLTRDPSSSIPEEVDRRCLQVICHYYTKQKVRSACHFTLKAIKRVAMAAGIAALLFLGAFAASETVRINTLNMFIEVFDTHTAFQFVGQAEPEKTTPQMSVGWLPEGYTLEESGSNRQSIWYRYMKAEEDMIYIDCATTYGTTVGVDTEDAEIEHVKVHGADAMLIKKGVDTQLVWTDRDNTVFLTVLGTKISSEELLHIADSLEY